MALVKKRGSIRVRQHQIEMMVKEMENNPLLNTTKYSSSFTSAKRNEYWNKLSQKLNNFAGAVKSVKSWQKTWSDKKSEVKKKLTILKAERLKTGTDDNEQKLTKLEERILLLINLDAEGLDVEEREAVPEEVVILKVEGSPDLPTSESCRQEPNQTVLEQTVLHETPSHLSSAESSWSESLSPPLETPKTKEKQKTNSTVLNSDIVEILAEGQIELAMAFKKCVELLKEQNELQERALEIKKRKVEALEKAVQIKKLKLDALLLKF